MADGVVVWSAQTNTKGAQRLIGTSSREKEREIERLQRASDRTASGRANPARRIRIYISIDKLNL